MKYIFVTGGVVSGLGKGICAASLGRLLKQCGLRVRNQKFDPYLNVDPGTMSPYQHGEVFVTDDGAETDLDLGHYERFVDEDADRRQLRVLRQDILVGAEPGASGRLSGRHGADHPPRHRRDQAPPVRHGRRPAPTWSSPRSAAPWATSRASPIWRPSVRWRRSRGGATCLYIHVPLVVSIPGSGELKSKPTQHSVKELLSVGIQPDVLVCRTDSPLPEDMRRKIALFCNVSEDCVIQNLTASTLYEVPLHAGKGGPVPRGVPQAGLGRRRAGHAPTGTSWWSRSTAPPAARDHRAGGQVHPSCTTPTSRVAEALCHAGTACGARVDIRWVDSEHLTAGEHRRCSSPAATAFWCPAASATGASRA